MEKASWFCSAASAVLFFTLLWKLKEEPGPGSWSSALWALVWTLGGFFLSVSAGPLVGGAAFLCCSLHLYVTARRSELLPRKNQAVLITGCDSGFGHLLAKRLSEMGVTVFAGVLDVNGPGAQQLRKGAPENLQVLQLDVTDCSQIQTARRFISTQVGHTGLWGLVNNAGVLRCPMDGELQPISDYRLFMDVNFLGAVRMCQVFLPLLRRSGGRVVNVTSLSGVVPFPTYAAYGSSKAALWVFSQVMRMELSTWGVKVIVIAPAGFRTNIFGTADDVARYRHNILASISSDAREDYGEEYILSLTSRLSRIPQLVAKDLSPVVDDMSHALLAVHPKHLYTPGNMGWLLPFLHRCCPTAAFNAFITRNIMQTPARRPAELSRA